MQVLSINGLCQQTSAYRVDLSPCTSPSHILILSVLLRPQSGSIIKKALIKYPPHRKISLIIMMSPEGAMIFAVVWTIIGGTGIWCAPLLNTWFERWREFYPNTSAMSPESVSLA